MAKKVKEEQPQTEETTDALPKGAAAIVEALGGTVPVLDPLDTSALVPHLRESTVKEVRELFAKADALLAVLEKRADARFARARIKLGETVGALR